MLLLITLLVSYQNQLKKLLETIMIIFKFSQYFIVPRLGFKTLKA